MNYYYRKLNTTPKIPPRRGHKDRFKIVKKCRNFAFCGNKIIGQHKLRVYCDSCLDAKRNRTS